MDGQLAAEVSGSKMADELAINVVLQRLNTKIAAGELSPKAECFLRVELGQTVLLSETTRLTHSKLQESPQVELGGVAVTIPCNPHQPQTLATITQHPLLISFTEVLPKDKKQKEDKFKVRGQTTLDLLPYALGLLPPHDTCTLSLHPTDDQNPASEEKSEVIINIISNVVNVDTDSNVLTLRLRSLHSLPEAWTPSSFPYTFTAGLPLPPTSSVPPSSAVIIPQGVLKQAPSTDTTPFPTHWKWPSKIVSPDASKASPIEPHPLEDEVGMWHARSDYEFRQKVESNHPKVEWNVQHRTWLSADDAHSLLKHLSQSPLWPLEVGRVAVIPPTVGKGAKANKEPVEPSISFHSVAYLDLSPLLYPGASSICGAFSLHPYSRMETLTKTDHNLASTLATPTPSAGGLAEDLGVKKMSVRTAVSSGKVSDLMGSAEEGEVPVKREAAAYEEVRTYVFVEVELHKPLIAKRPVSALAQRVDEYIPARGAFPQHIGGVQWAVEDFQAQTASIASQLVQEFRALHDAGQLDKDEEVGLSVNPKEESTHDEADKRRHQFIFHLNSSGKYHSIKEQLKRSVVKVVREKYLNQVCPEDQDKFQHFLSDLYVFLVDNMHVGLRKVFSIEGSAPSVASPLTSDLLKHFAMEAESVCDYDLAERYYKERVCRCGHDSVLWYEYAIFCLLASRPDRCEQSLKEAVALDSTMIPALLLYGMVCCLDEKYDIATEFFEMATTYDSSNIIAWTMRGLFYEHSCNQLMQKMCFHEAEKLNSGHRSKTYLHLAKTPASKSGLLPPTQRTSKVSLASKIPSTNLMQPSFSRGSTEGAGIGGGINEESSQKELNSSNVSCVFEDEDHTTRPATSQRNSVSQGHASASESLVINRSSLGTAGVKAVHETVLADSALLDRVLDDDGGNHISIFLQTASFLLDVHALKFAEMSLAHELMSGCNHKTCPTYLVAEARLHMHRDMYKEALKCLKKALMADIQNATALALLGHTHFQLGEWPEAQDAYKRTLGYMTPPIDTHLVYTRLASIYLRQEKYEEAKETLLHACKRSPSSRTWFGVGVACYRLGDLEQAEDALTEANILNNLDPDVWAYLTMVCLKTQRPVEAEQALKFALKVGLKDQELLTQIQQLHSIHSPHADLVHIPTLPPQPSQLAM